MVTKEQCILDRILELADYGSHGDVFIKRVVDIFNQGKRYASEMVFRNDDVGIDEVLDGMTEEDAEYFKYELENGDGPYYSSSDPFITFDRGIKSVDMDDFKKMLTPEIANQILNDDAILANFDESDYHDAFAKYIEWNCPEYMDRWTGDWEEQYLYDFDFRNGDWEKLARTLGGNVVNLSESDLRMITNKILNEILRKK